MMQTRLHRPLSGTEPPAPMSAATFLGWLASGTGMADLPVLVIAAHPDDETIGVGALLPRLRDVKVLHVTDGAPRDGRDARQHGFADIHAYAAARRGELRAALALAGIGPARILAFDLPDQRAAFELPLLTLRLAGLLAEQQPAVVITHSYEGGHPDHDATAFAVHMALRLLEPPHPVLLEMASYHAGPEGFSAGCFLPADESATVTISLPAEAQALKRRMFDCFVSQRQVLAMFKASTESLRPAPRHDFTQPPHPGRLHYENFPWGMTGERFCKFAAAAKRELGLGGAR